jgi:outer membrane protein TolC
VIGYQSTVLNALEEVENALVSYSQEQERRDRLNDAVAHSQLAVDLATEQYKAGLVDFLSVLDAQRDLYANEDQLVQSQTSVTTNLVGLYRALGGGWNLGRTVGVANSSKSVTISRLVGSDLRTCHRSWTDYGLFGSQLAALDAGSI